VQNVTKLKYLIKTKHKSFKESLKKVLKINVFKFNYFHNNYPSTEIVISLWVAPFCFYIFKIVEF